MDITALVERVLEQPCAHEGAVRRCELLDAAVNRLVRWQTQAAPIVALDGRSSSGKTTLAHRLEQA